MGTKGEKVAKKWPQIGDLVKDRITGLEGVVTARSIHLNMCDRLIVQPRVTSKKPDDLPKPWSMDCLDLSVVEENAVGLDEYERQRTYSDPPAGYLGGPATVRSEAPHEERATGCAPSEPAEIR